MSEFGIVVYGALGAPLLIPAGLGVEPLSWSAVDVGGMWDAEIAVRGGLPELAGLTAWLGCRLEIVNGNGTAVWWGDVATVEITADGVRRGVSLERLANRVQVRYAQRAAGGAVAAADTAWMGDEFSQADYGIRERRISPERAMTAAEAESYRATALAALREPHYTLAPDAGETAARLYCTGDWQRLKHRYYVEPAGLVAHVASGTAAPLGLGFTSNKVAFVAYTDQMHSIAGYFAGFKAGYRVRVAGAAQAGNNGAWLLDSGNDDRTAASYTSTAVTFSPNDDIADANGGLGFLDVNDVFTISGTDSNNGTHLVAKAGAAAIEVSAAYHGGLIASESAGDTAVFSRGNLAKVVGGLINEGVGANVTVTAWGQKHYQPFALPSLESWTAASVEIRLRRVGGPVDGVIVQLVADNAGVPGTVLDSATVAADDIPLEMGWVTFVLANTAALNYGTAYGLTVARTGANDPANYYEIDLDAGATYGGGALRQWEGAAWQTPDPAASLIFRVLGAKDSGLQVQALVQAQGWAMLVEADYSNVLSNQWRDGETRAFDEAAALLAMGTRGGRRLLARVGRNRAAGIYERPLKEFARWVLRGARLYDLFGQEAEAGYLPAGEWVQLGDADALGPWARLSPVFAERATWQAGTGLSIEPEGTADMYDSGVMQG
ncbi:MAG: hypothetical protein KAX65_01090 [Caldilineaceae bacterium]|nr:hypothetical protein [Caldilineaceae bacterium]